MKQEGKDNDERQPQSDDGRRDFDFGWRDRIGFRLTGLSERDVSRLAVAAVFAIIAFALTSLAFAFTLVWDRVSTLW